MIAAAKATPHPEKTTSGTDGTWGKNYPWSPPQIMIRHCSRYGSSDTVVPFAQEVPRILGDTRCGIAARWKGRGATFRRIVHLPAGNVYVGTELFVLADEDQDAVQRGLERAGRSSRSRRRDGGCAGPSARCRQARSTSCGRRCGDHTRRRRRGCRATDPRPRSLPDPGEGGGPRPDPAHRSASPSRPRSFPLDHRSLSGCSFPWFLPNHREYPWLTYNS